MSDVMNERADLMRDTTVVRDAQRDGRFLATIPDAWGVVNAFGGVAFALGLRAIHACLGRLRPIAASGTFTSGIPCGPVVVDVQLLKRGRTLAQARAEVRGKDASEAGLTMLATFGSDELAPRHAYLFPDWAPPPEQCRPTDPALWQGVALVDQSERLEVPTPSRGEVGFRPALARAVEWARLRVPALQPDGTLDTIGTASFFGDSLASAIPHEPSLHATGAIPLTLDLSVQYFGTTRSDWLLKDCCLQHEAQGLLYGSVELWGEDRTLVAVAHQRALCRILK